MSHTAQDFSCSEWTTGSFTDIPVGDEPTVVGPEIFESFKDTQGRFRTQSLFCEYPHDSYPAFFTLKKYKHTKNGKSYISMYEKYMEIGDPTEYQVAIQLLGSWDHWLALTKTKWFMDVLTGWREELQVKLESERFHEMRDIAKGKDQGAATATKWLADRYGEKAVAKRGRPSNAEKKAHLKRITEEEQALSEDAQRIGLA